MFLPIGVLLLIFAIFPYAVYVLGIFFIKSKKTSKKLHAYPGISIVIPCYNEEAVIGKRIRNIAESTYPAKSIETILVDDQSNDSTVSRAEKAFVECGLDYRIIRNEERSGTNRSFNRGISQAKYDIVVTTGADVFFEKRALEKVIARLMSEEEIAAVCADMLPLSASHEMTTGGIESTYRNYYGRMCDWESSIDSTYNFNGGLVAFKKTVIPSIRERKGADDANTAFEAISRGYRAVYEIDAVVFEDIPRHLSRQYSQKIRRATRLIEATIANFSVIHQNRPFSRIFFPLRVYMLLLSPFFFLIGLCLVLIGVALHNPAVMVVLAACVAIVSMYRPNNVFFTFGLFQWYLFNGLLNQGKDMRIWESTSKKTNG